MTRERSYSDVTLILRVLRQARPYWLKIAALFVLGLATTPLALLQPLPLKIVVDSVLGGHPLPRVLGPVLPAHLDSGRVLAIALGLIVATAFLNQLRRLAMTVLRVHTGQQLILHTRKELFRHVQRLSLSFHDARGTTESIYRIQADAPAIQQIAVNTIIPVISAGTTFCVMFYVVVRLDWRLALIGIVLAPALATIAYVRRRMVRPRYREAAALETSAQAVLHEVLGALRVVKAFGQEEREGRRYLARSSAGMQARQFLAVAETSFDAAMRIVTASGTAIVLFVGVRHVQSGVLTLGELILVMSYLGQLFGPLNALSNSGARMQESLASVERVFRLLDETPDVIEHPHAVRVARAGGAIAFRDVSFSYDGERSVLRGVSFDISPGSRVALVGRTGAGKTTLVSLLMRFYDPVSGQILLDDVDVREYKLADLREQFGVVLQEPVLFSASIAENISYARPGASQADIVGAAKIASAHEFITALPDGYDTLVGERGMRLSGGERQRVSLARAFLKDAPVVIFDEPTSSVDQKTEAAIVEAVERLMQGRTTLMIAHRLSTLHYCDTFLRIEDGRVMREDQMVRG
jgi:ATP-binding cassette subfamily B protein